VIKVSSQHPDQGQGMSGREGSRRHRNYVVLGLAMAAATLLAACGGSITRTAPTPSAVPAAELEQSLNTKGANLVKDFEIQVYQGEAVLGGTDILFSSLFGDNKPVVLNFWAGLCPPCRAEIPDLQEFNAEHQDTVTLFGLDIGPFVGLGSREEGQELLQELGVTYPAGTTFDATVIQAYQVFGMPTTVLLTSDGEVFRKWTGIITRDKLAELVDELVKVSP